MSIRRQPKPAQPPVLDLTAITRDTDVCSTRVRLHLDWDTRLDWIVMGLANLDYSDGTKSWRLTARMSATDFEHDSAYAIVLPLVGVTFESVMYGCTQLVAWVDGSRNDDFHVPEPGYNPMTLPNTTKCKQCKGDDAHLIVPEGCYVPPYNDALWQMVRGKRVEISVGPKFKDG